MSISCAGGWCQLRETCAHYWQPDDQPVDRRLCEPGQHDAYQRVIFTKAGPTTQPEEVPA